MLAHPYSSATAILTSKHQKLSLIGPALSEATGAVIRELPLDTDALGTFSGEVERTQSPLETAIAKARMGMQATGIPLGIASEGSIGNDPLTPMLVSDIEIIVVVDDERNIVISESFRSFDISAGRIEVRVGTDISDFLKRVDFPNHHLIVKYEGANGLTSVKGISEKSMLDEVIEESIRNSRNALVIVESDFRAHHSPSRQKNIRQAAQKLAARVATLCPGCDCPGWGTLDYQRGVPCQECGEMNGEIAHREIVGCVSCDRRDPGKVINESIDPARCFRCNP